MAGEARFGPGGPGGPPDTAPGPRTALPIRSGRPRHSAAHLERLMAGLAALDQPGAWLPAAWDAALAWASDQGPDLAVRARVDGLAQVLHLRTEPLPPTPQAYALLPMAHPFQSQEASRLLPHKGCLGAWHTDLLHQAKAHGADDALLCAPDGTVLETAIAAVGLASPGRFSLPPTAGRVRSIAELWDLPAWADERGWTLVQEAFTLEDLSQGTLWCFNALRGLWPAHPISSPSRP